MTKFRFRLKQPADDTVVQNARHLEQLAFMIAWSELLGEMVLEVPDEQRAETEKSLKLLGAEFVVSG